MLFCINKLSKQLIAFVISTVLAAGSVPTITGLGNLLLRDKYLLLKGFSLACGICASHCGIIIIIFVNAPFLKTFLHVKVISDLCTSKLKHEKMRKIVRRHSQSVSTS